MTFSEPPWMKTFRRIQAQEAALRKRLELASDPFRMLDEVRTFWQQEQERQDKWLRLFKTEQLSLSISGPAEAAANLARAFERLHASVKATDAANDAMRLRVLEHQQMYERLASISFATSEIGAQLDSLLSAKSAFKPFTQRLGILATSAAHVYESDSLITDSVTESAQWVMQAPALEPYAAARSVTVLAGVPARTTDPDADALLDDLDSGLEGRLIVVSPSLVEPYRGAILALKDGKPDWPRHCGSSLRTLLDELIALLAPDAELEAYLENPNSHKADGVFTRRIRLEYIFRDVAKGAYAKMAENDIDMTLATFFPENAAVHALLPALNRGQAQVLLRRVQGCIATLLATQEA